MNHVTSCKSRELVPWADSLRVCIPVCTVHARTHLSLGGFVFESSAQDQNLIAN